MCICPCEWLGELIKFIALYLRIEQKEKDQIMRRNIFTVKIHTHQDS
jgi:hypothetical protein